MDVWRLGGSRRGLGWEDLESLAPSCGSSGFEPPALSPQVLLKVLEDCAVDTHPEGVATGLCPFPLTLVQSWTSLFTKSQFLAESGPRHCPDFGLRLLIPFIFAF